MPIHVRISHHDRLVVAVAHGTITAEELQNAGRLKQIRMVAKLVHQQNKRALPIVFGSAVGIIVVFVVIGLLVGLLGLFIGPAAMAVLVMLWREFLTGDTA